MMPKQDYQLLSAILRDTAQHGPRVANLYIESLCNIKCEYCWFHSPLNKKLIRRISIPLSAIKKNIDQLHRLGIQYIVISSHGEPALHPNIAAIINYIKRKNIKLRITTNLTFNREDIRVAFAQVDFLAVTLSAHNKTLYTKIHSPASSQYYATVIKNLKLYVGLGKKKKKSQVEIRYIITKNNYKKIKHILALAEQLELYQIRFRILDTTPQTQKLTLNKKEIVDLRKILHRLCAKPLKIKHNMHKLYNSLDEKGAVQCVISRCFVGWLRISLELNGDIGFCCQNDKLIIGNWKKDRLQKAWYSRKADRLRTKAKNDFNITKKFWEVCQFCFMEEQNKTIDRTLKQLTQ